MSVDPGKLGGPFASVFDIGAFQGDFARACLAAWPDCRVESFEPLMDAPVDLNGRWRWWRTALGARQGETGMYRNEFIPSSSILKMKPLHSETFPYTKRVTTTTVHIDPLSEYEEFIIEPALLKIDVQGFEGEVLRGAGDALHKFSTIVLEVSWEALYEGSPTWEQIDTFLTLKGFSHAGRVDEMPHPKDGRILQSDEAFHRN